MLLEHLCFETCWWLHGGSACDRQSVALADSDVNFTFAEGEQAQSGTKVRLLLPGTDSAHVWARDDPGVRSRERCLALTVSQHSTSASNPDDGEVFSLRRHIVDANGANPAFREAPVRKHTPSCLKYQFDGDLPNRLAEQRRLCWNPGLRRGKEGSIEEHIAGKWHIITLQEAIEYLDHEYLTNDFSVAHHGGCAIVFNMDTFLSDMKVSSV